MTDYDSLWDLIIRDGVANGDEGYAKFIAKWPLSYYRSRVRQAGMAGFHRVLDVGCGFGQWCTALALENIEAVGLEIHKQRLETARRLALSLGLENVSFAFGNALALPFLPGSFDALFCYGVFMFMDRSQTLAEFARVLRPGGMLYVCTNARGWWLKLAIENASKDRSIARVGWRAFRKGRQHGIPNATDKSDVAGLLDTTQWMDVHVAAEGRLRVGDTDWDTDARIEPVYQPRYLGYDCVIEFTATKRGGGASKGYRPATVSMRRIDAIVERTVREQTYSLRDKLILYPMPEGPADLVNHTNKLSVAQAAETVSHINRTAVLQRTFAAITEGCTNDLERLRACITFAQKRFYHHFAGQPMLDHNQVVMDPVMSLVIGACRCGNSARFLIDLLAAGHFSARLLGCACHTSAEVAVDGEWLLADASLYPPGIAPTGSKGRWLTTDEALANPSLLDMAPNYVNYEVGHIDCVAALYPEAYGQVEKWLREPILPSVGYFGADFAGDRKPGSITRWTKLGDSDSWEGDRNYGWLNLSLDETVQGVACATIQRPQQPRDITLDGNVLRWTHKAAFDDIIYRVVLSEQDVTWSYDAIPVGCDFSIAGEPFITNDCKFALPERWLKRRFTVTVNAERRSLPNVFYLASDPLVVSPAG